MKNYHILLYFIIILLVANLCGTIWLISKTSISSQSNTLSTQSNHTIDKLKLIEIFNKILSVYNSGDKDAIWEVFSDYAKSQMDKEDSMNSIIKLKKMFGDIDKGTYMFQEFVGKQGNLSFHKAYFSVDLLNSNLGDKALLTIIISNDGSANEITGFQLNIK